MEAMVTNGAVSRAKLQSNCHTNKPTPTSLQAGCPSCRPTNSVKSLKGNSVASGCSKNLEWSNVLVLANAGYPGNWPPTSVSVTVPFWFWSVGWRSFDTAARVWLWISAVTSTLGRCRSTLNGRTCWSFTAGRGGGTKWRGRARFSSVTRRVGSCGGQRLF